jgi:hypothetical protein
VCPLPTTVSLLEPTSILNVVQLSCRNQRYDEDRSEATSLGSDTSLRIAWDFPLFAPRK